MNSDSLVKLGPGVEVSDVDAAIRKSGYPLQLAVARDLAEGGFWVTEEWCYRDYDSGELRTIDMLADKPVYKVGSRGLRARPIVDLLIECKQSALPYVFFLSPIKKSFRVPTLLAGLHHETLTLRTNDSRSSWIFSVGAALELEREPFLALHGDKLSPTFSKCVRKGKDLELSGSDAYANAILPLVKAARHFLADRFPPRTFQYFDCNLVVLLLVLDAPMVGVQLIGNSHELVTSFPWCRVLRHEHQEAEHRSERHRLFVVDVVQRDFLGTFVEQHLNPFVQVFAQRIIKHHEEVAAGKGFARDLGSNSLEGIEKRLGPAREVESDRPTQGLRRIPDGPAEA